MQGEPVYELSYKGKEEKKESNRQTHIAVPIFMFFMI